MMKELVNLKKARSFTQEDWYRFAGANGFDESTAPMMFEIDETILCTADKKGIEVYIYTDEEDTLKDPDFYAKKGTTKDEIFKDYDEVIGIITKFTKGDIPNKLLDIGFVQYS